ncbi:uncharacterized protein G2W53_014682 [Senna tora]|uniref:Secreted protein n=1 Tax=Senna tora TaxID=362788 RepID=A0A835C4I0_9FABA|nr:uncharacterized protein G2W53_014682 [Senna tora]
MKLKGALTTVLQLCSTPALQLCSTPALQLCSTPALQLCLTPTLHSALFDADASFSSVRRRLHSAPFDASFIQLRSTPSFCSFRRFHLQLCSTPP